MLEVLQHELVQVTEEIQNEVCQRIIDLIRHERMRRSWWNRFKTFLSRFKKCRCVCGATGIGCECEQKELPQVIPPSVRIARTESHSVVEAHPETDRKPYSPSVSVQKRTADKGTQTPATSI